MKHIGIFNLMPSGAIEKTQQQWKQIIESTKEQVKITFLTFDDPSLLSGNDIEKQKKRSHMVPFSQIRNTKFERIIISGAGVELIDERKNRFLPALHEVFDWTQTSSYSTLFSCWSSHTALQYFYGIPRILQREKKIFGLFPHYITSPTHPLVRDLSEYLTIPHSRYGNIPSPFLEHKNIEILIKSYEERVGFHLACTPDMTHVFLQGHPEYDEGDLHQEYIRDTGKTALPENYYSSQGVIRPKDWGNDMQAFMKNWISTI